MVLATKAKYLIMGRSKQSGYNGWGFIIEDIKSIKKDFFSYFFLFFQFVYLSGLIRQLGTDGFLVLNIFITLLLCLINKKITKKAVKVILISFAIFSSINLISIFVFGLNQKLFAGYLGRIFLGYLIVIFFKNSFFEKFEKLVTFLALISLPLFIIQIIYPDFYNIFDSISNAVLSEERTGQYYSDSHGHKYLFIFLFNSWGPLRNSGFMWEPAGFGAMLTWAAIFNLLRNNFKMNNRLYILLLTALTTFSVGTYVYLTGIFLLVILKNRKAAFLNTLFFLSIIAIIGSQLYIVTQNIELMQDKIITEEINRERALSGAAQESEISRVAGFELSIKYFSDWPFGYGLNAERSPDLKYLGLSPNGLMKMVVTWGIFGLIIIIWSVKNLIKFLGKYYSNDLSWFFIWSLVILYIIPISGNPLYNQPLLFSLLFGIWILKDDILNFKLEKNQNYKISISYSKR